MGGTPDLNLVVNYFAANFFWQPHNGPSPLGHWACGQIYLTLFNALPSLELHYLYSNLLDLGLGFTDPEFLDPISMAAPARHGSK